MGVGDGNCKIQGKPDLFKAQNTTVFLKAMPAPTSPSPKPPSALGKYDCECVGQLRKPVFRRVGNSTVTFKVGEFEETCPHESVEFDCEDNCSSVEQFEETCPPEGEKFDCKNHPQSWLGNLKKQVCPPEGGDVDCENQFPKWKSLNILAVKKLVI